jgi:hypothetical protein
MIRIINIMRKFNLQFWQPWHVFKMWKRWIRSIQISNSPGNHILSIVNHNEKMKALIICGVCVCTRVCIILTSQWGFSKVKFQQELAHSNHSLGSRCENIYKRRKLLQMKWQYYSNLKKLNFVTGEEKKNHTASQDVSSSV